MGNPEDAFQQSVQPVQNSGNEKHRITSACNGLTSEDADNDHDSKSNDYNGLESDTVLDLSSRLISEFPAHHLDIACSHIVNLNIEYNDICEIPCGLSQQLPNLQVFRADGNELDRLPDDFGDFQFLRELCICENKLFSLPESLMKLKNLRSLRVSSNSLRQLHSEIGQNSALEEIHAEENKLKRLPSTLGLLKQLHTLIASDNRIEQLVTTIGECESLQVVDFSRNKISHIPESFGSLTNLTRIDLSENKIYSMCESFSSCGSLEYIFLDLNMFGKFPKWFSDLEKIQEISMKSNELGGAAVPEGFGCKSQYLRVLDLRGNFIEVLPESFCHLSSLQVCSLGTPLDYLERSPSFQNGNWLTHLPENFHNLTALTKLCVEENQVLALPQEIGELVNLEQLFFGSNMISELPASFTNLPSLRVCQLSKNRLKRLPEDFGALSTLQELYLDSNMLRKLPPSLSQLVNLEVFDLTENKLKDVPREILACMTKLKALNMFYNKFEVPYSDIPYISKKIHYAEKNPEFKDTWRGRNNASNTMVPALQDQNSESASMSERKEACISSDDDIDDPNDAGDDSSEEDDWDTQIVASSSESSELANYMHVVTPRDDSDDEDWDNDVRDKDSRQLSSDKVEGQFDLDDEVEILRPILPSPVRFDICGNSSRPMDFAVHHHRQTPYIHHAPSVDRLLYCPEPCVEGQFDSDIEEEEEGAEGESITQHTLQ